MKRRYVMLMLCALLAFGLCTEAVAVPVSAATDKDVDLSSPEDLVSAEDPSSSDISTSSDNSGSKNNSKNKNKKTLVDSEGNELTDSDQDSSADSDSEAASDTASGSKKSTKTTTKKTTSGSSSNSSTKSSSVTDSHGNRALMTESQRRNKFRSKTNPKRGEKPDSVNRPKAFGFTYADFGTYNSYSSDNGLGGNPIYLLGTITDIQKAYENDLNYGTAVMVNDCDGYQWYMRVEVSKLKYDLFRKDYLGKSGYIYGRYSGYSGVTNRPMLDITVIQPNGGVMTDMKLYR
ncbi:MAG: hypothetical protein K6G58_05025 [Lachnospiraceae bacterium]|nr:hypothetical protein [Lachnospiraceae bacterium]